MLATLQRNSSLRVHHVCFFWQWIVLVPVFPQVTVLWAFIPSILGTHPQSSLTYSCSGSNIIYTCVLCIRAPGVITAWSGSAFQCPPTNQISLTQSVSGRVQPFTPVSCGSLSAVTTNVTSTCYTSVLTIPAVQALNGTTVVCADGFSGTVVGNGTVDLRMAGGLSENQCPL